jgi:hypothetical protein
MSKDKVTSTMPNFQERDIVLLDGYNHPRVIVEIDHSRAMARVIGAMSPDTYGVWAPLSMLSLEMVPSGLPGNPLVKATSIPIHDAVVSEKLEDNGALCRELTQHLFNTYNDPYAEDNTKDILAIVQKYLNP